MTKASTHFSSSFILLILVALNACAIREQSSTSNVAPKGQRSDSYSSQLDEFETTTKVVKKGNFNFIVVTSQDIFEAGSLEKVKAIAPLVINKEEKEKDKKLEEQAKFNGHEFKEREFANRFVLSQDGQLVIATTFQDEPTHRDLGEDLKVITAGKIEVIRDKKGNIEITVNNNSSVYCPKFSSLAHLVRFVGTNSVNGKIDLRLKRKDNNKCSMGVKN